jgi:AraC-like DNA-binding protein
MNEILQTLESLRSRESAANGKSPVNGLGFISCGNTIHVRHVPFYVPCIILVLTGRKVIHDKSRPVAGEAGTILTVPAPSSFDLRNEPDARSRKYRALIIPFEHDLLEHLNRMHGIGHSQPAGHVGVLKFDSDDTLLSSIRHYLACVGDRRLMTHRLMEILLILVGKNPKLLSYVLNGQNWSQRVRAVVATDLTRSWDLTDICKQLTTTESTLRRHLKKEDTGFRKLLHELRLSTALMRLLQTSLPVYRIAYDCGYQSVSRFSSNFHKRFGLPPRQLRESVNESEQKLTVSEHSPAP